MQIFSERTGAQQEEPEKYKHIFRELILNINLSKKTNTFNRRAAKYQALISTVVQLQHRHEGFLRHINLAHRLHPLLTLCLFLQQFLLP